jgi:hypothetical protein
MKRYMYKFFLAKPIYNSFLVGMMVWIYSNSAFAHEYEVHEANIDLMEWIIGGLTVMSIIIIVTIWGGLLRSAYREKNHRAFLSSFTVFLAFILWFALIATQHWVYLVSMGFGYIVLPFALIALWRAVLLHVRGHLIQILHLPGYRKLLIGSIIVYGIFYLFGSGLVSPPDPEDPPLPTYGYVASYESYGPLTVWPNFEFWWPLINLYGAVSVGTLMMLLTIAGFMGISIVLVVYNWKFGAAKSPDLKDIGGTVGSSVAVTMTSFCCCCFPVIYPLLILLLGSAATETLTVTLVSASGPLFNFIQMAILSLMAKTAISAAKRLDQIHSGTCAINSVVK